MPDGFRIATAYVTVSPDLAEFEQELKAKLDAATAGADAKVKVGVDKSALDSGLAEAKAKIDELDGKSATAKLDLEKGGFDAGVDEASGKLDEFGGRSASARLDLEKGGFDAGADEARDSLDELSGRSASPKLGLDKAAFDDEKDEADARLDANDARTASPKLGLDKSVFDTKAAEAQAELDRLGGESANPRLGGSGGGGRRDAGGLIGALAMGVGALTPGIAGAATGLGLLGGVGATAFGGIASALSAAHQASTNVGTTSAQLASTHFSNAVAAQQAAQQVTQAQQQQAQDEITSAAQIRQAEQGVAQARQQAAADAVSSAESIESAQANLANAERQAASSEIAALQQVTQAQQGVEQADYALREAQYQLSQAWEQARERVTQLTDALADSKLNTQAASLAVQQAERQELLVNQNAYSTDLDRQQATLAVAQAKQQLKDATDAQSAAQYAADNKQQASHQIITQAQQAVTQATYGQKDAQTALADAQRNVTQTQLNNAAAIKSAQLQLTEAEQQAAQTRLRDSQQVSRAEQSLASAEEQAGYQRRQDAQAVSQAQKNLTNTLREQQLQQAATASTANQAANQFAADMARLTPAGRGFVNEILSMKGAWKGFSSAIQEAVLPGATQLLKGVSTMFPELQAGAVKFGQEMGSAFSSLGKEASTSGAHKVLQGLIDNGSQFAQIVLPAMDHFVGSLAELGAKQGAVKGIADLLAGILNGLSGFAKGLAPAIPAFDQIAEAAGKLAAALGPALAQDITAIANALAPLARFLNSKAGGPFIDGLAQAGAALLIFKGTMKLLPDFISGPLQSLAGRGIDKLITDPVKKGADKLGGILGGAAKSGGSRLLGGVRSAMSGVASAVSEQAGKIPGLFSRAWSGIASGASALPGRLAGVWESVQLRGMYAWDAIRGGASRAWSGISSAASAAASGLSSVWSGITSAATAAWSGVASFGSRFGSMMASAGSSVASFAATMGRNLAQAAAATAAWIGRQAVAAATFIAENVAEAASATAAWIAENAATLGLGVAIAALVAGVIWLATHWKQAWGAIKQVASDAWHDVLKPVFDAIGGAADWLYQNAILPMWHGIDTAFHGVATVAEWMYDYGIKPQFQAISAIADWLYNNAVLPMWHGIDAVFHWIANTAGWLYDVGIKEPFQQIATVANWLLHNVFDPVWNGIQAGARNFVGGFRAIWDRLQNIFKTPVNFLIGTVYDNGIRRFWNDIVNAVGLKSLDLPVVAKLAHGGLVPGTDHGRDEVLIAARPEEGVLVPGAVRAIGGPAALHALNAAHGGGQPGDGRHFAGGGIVPGWLSGIAHGIGSFLGGAVDAAKVAAAVATGNTTALTNALARFVGTDATAAGLARVMTAIPKTLATDLVKALTGQLAPAGSGGVAGNVRSYAADIAAVLQMLHQPASDLGAVEHRMQQESGGNPSIVNRWDTNWARGTPSVGLMQVIGPTFAEYAGPYRNTGPFEYGVSTNPMANIYAGLNYALHAYGGRPLASVMLQSGGYDSGGILPPGPTMAVNQTGQPEAVLTAQQWSDIHAIAVRAQQQGAAGQGPTVVNNWYGPQMPSTETLAEMDRRMALQLSGAAG